LKSFTSHANVTGYAEASKWVIGPAPLSPRINASQLVRTSFPSGVTAPRPVMTTRLRPLSEPLSLNHIPIPPSTRSTSPVMNEASSEQRKRTAPATSVGCPARPRGVFWIIAAMTSSGRTSVSWVVT
jgi:hypothetical protein